ncbi:MAG: proton-conducting transporter membrane subunit [Pseudomonadota bacterium]|jgi:formate hydrogenlyase subunit 3/multisubunit Na+/H+ antiporter MnhD subunit
MPWMILIPLGASTLSFLLGERARWQLTAAAVAGQGWALAGLLMQVWEEGPQRHPVGGWGAPLGIDLRADGLSATMLTMTALVGGFVSVYALGCFSRDRAGGAYFWPLWWFLWAALNALFLSGDVFNLYVTLELLGLGAVALVCLGGEPGALVAGLRYLLAALLGSLAYLMGVALLYGAHGTLALDQLGLLVRPGIASTVAAALMTVGLLLKTALFPLHYWLPPAHGGAPVPVSALLSGLVVKASFYILLRLWFEVFPAALTPAWAQGLGGLGAAAIVWGAWHAFHQEKLKMLVAWSTVAQIGYLFLLFPLATSVAPAEAALAWSGGVYQALSHGLAKAAMFLAAGSMIHATGEERVESLDGISRHLPLTLFTFALAGMNLMGLPPSGGFIAKWLLLESALASGQWGWVAVLITGALLTAGYVFRVLRHAFLPPRPDARVHVLPGYMELAAFALAIGSLLLGLTATFPLTLLEVGAPFAGVRAMP